MDAPCIRCAHPADQHDPNLGYCEHDGCRCLIYVSEADELEAGLGSGDLPRELDFSDGDER